MVLWWGFPPMLWAQATLTISGYVKDARSGETLIQANVYLPELQVGATTNSQGYYIITEVPPGTHLLVASYLGYQDFRREITLRPGQHLRLDIELQPAVIEGEEVVVEAPQPIEEEKAVGLLNVPPRLVGELPAVLETDLFRAMQLLPGIKAASDFSSGLYIRGGSPDQTLILLDRTTVYNPSHFFGFFSTFNPDAIKDVHIYKGGYPAQYGGRLGSVVDIYNRDGNRKEFQGRGSLGLLASRLNVEGPLPKGSWMLAGRRSTLEPVLSILRKTEEDIPDVFYFFDLNGKINYDPGANDRLSLAFYGGDDNVKFPFADDADFKLNYGNRTVSLNWTHVFSQILFSNFTLTRSRYFNFAEFNIAGTPFQRENQVFDNSIQGDFELIPNRHHALKAGFWISDLSMTFKNRFDREETLSEKIDNQFISGYVQETYKPDPLWSITGGVRASFATGGDFLRFEPRLSVERIYSQQLLFQAAYGRYYQFLTLITNEAFSGFDTWLTTGKGVPPAWGDQFVVGIKTRPGEGYSADVEVYYRTMRDLFEFDPLIQDPAGLAYRELFRFGDGYAYGAEFFLEKKVGRMTGFLGYTFSVSRRRFPGYNQNRYYPPKYDRTHDLNLVINYRLSSSWRFTAVFTYATGQAYTPVLGGYRVNFPFSTGKGLTFVVGDLNEARLPPYHRLDVGFTRRGRFFHLGQYQLQIQAINLYSRRNIWFYSYDIQKDPFTREDVQMLPIIPNLSLTIDF
ncbi:MAG: TonB-dependent receptor [Calditrichaeota bacterium]|nr:MAG: TonB-dependent receptor [Calditrichota bacterium]